MASCERVVKIKIKNKIDKLKTNPTYKPVNERKWNEQCEEDIRRGKARRPMVKR